jgi:signal transduction histidine kinase
LPPDIQVSLYRTAQEALNNVAKHAQATKAHVELSCTPNRAKLCIEDNGRGFKLEGIGPQHLGLTIMRERAEAIGAKLDIQSQLGQGTKVSVIWDGMPKKEAQ